MKKIKRVWNWLDGKKSYLTAALLIVWSGLYVQGYIDQQTYQIGLSVLGGLGIASVRHAISKLE